MASDVPGTRPPSPWRYLPNAISLVRIALVLPVGLAIATRRFDTALWLAVVAGVSDALDGWLARRFNWRSRLGGMLDPLADKLLLLTCFLVLLHVGSVPLALVALVVGRDLVIVAGALAWRWLIGPFQADPSWLSKCCTMVQILYVLAVLLSLAGMPGLMLAPLAWLVAVMTAASGLDYVLRWSLRARIELRARRGHGNEH
jgi:cardiolipin synthase